MKVDLTTTKKSFLRYSAIIALILLLLCTWLLIDKFRKDYKPVIPIAKNESVLLDSINKIHLKYKDSVDKEHKIQKIRFDSVVRSNNDLRSKFSESVTTIKILSSQVVKSRVDKDTTAYFLNCDSLAEETSHLKERNDAVEKGFILERQYIESQLQALQRDIAERDNLIGKLQNSNKKLIGENIKVTSDVNKLAKKQGRRFSIAPTISYIFAEDLKPHVGIGIGLSYRFINFKL